MHQRRIGAQWWECHVANSLNTCHPNCASVLLEEDAALVMNLKDLILKGLILNLKVLDHVLIIFIKFGINSHFSNAFDHGMGGWCSELTISQGSSPTSKEGGGPDKCDNELVRSLTAEELEIIREWANQALRDAKPPHPFLLAFHFAYSSLFSVCRNSYVLSIRRVLKCHLIPFCGPSVSP